MEHPPITSRTHHLHPYSIFNHGIPSYGQEYWMRGPTDHLQASTECYRNPYFTNSTTVPESTDNQSPSSVLIPYDSSAMSFPEVQSSLFKEDANTLTSQFKHLVKPQEDQVVHKPQLYNHILGPTEELGNLYQDRTEDLLKVKDVSTVHCN